MGEMPHTNRTEIGRKYPWSLLNFQPKLVMQNDENRQFLPKFDPKIAQKWSKNLNNSIFFGNQ
jgi:glycosidase